MARPVDHIRRNELLDAAVDHVIDHGLAELSLRPLAAGLGVTPTTLVHHFGAKHALMGAVMNRVRERIVAVALEAADGATVNEATWAAWHWSTAPEHEPLFRLFFEVYGFALQHPVEYRAFLDRVVDDWLEGMSARLERGGLSAEDARVRATLGLAVVRGLVLDQLTTGDRQRTEAALRAFVPERDKVQ